MIRTATLIFLLSLSSIVLAQDDNWIEWGKVHSAAGEWCCGIADCGTMEPGTVHVTEYGYLVQGDVRMRSKGVWFESVSEVVPYSEVQISRDSHYWRCKRSDGSRRCFFAPPSGS